MTESSAAVNADRKKRLRGSVFKICLTGGPCAGKSTALAKVTSALTNLGIRVFTVPEAATLLFTNGVKFETPLSFQLAVLRVQTALEDNFERLARVSREPAVVLCDRGLMDGSAYVDERIWNEILATDGLEETDIRDNRYHSVIHMVTAADGAEDYYTLANNASRHENLDEAIAQDRKTQEAWTGHSRLVVIGNETGHNRTISFQKKVGKVIDAVKASLGLVCLAPQYERRFVLEKMISEVPSSSRCTMQRVYKTFFVSTVGRAYIQAKGTVHLSKGCKLDDLSSIPPPISRMMYSRVVFRTVSDDGKVREAEERRIISKREYDQQREQCEVLHESDALRISFAVRKYYVQIENCGDRVEMRIQPPAGLSMREIPKDLLGGIGVRVLRDITDEKRRPGV